MHWIVCLLKPNWCITALYVLLWLIDLKQSTLRSYRFPSCKRTPQNIEWPVKKPSIKIYIVNICNRCHNVNPISKSNSKDNLLSPSRSSVTWLCRKYLPFCGKPTRMPLVNLSSDPLIRRTGLVTRSQTPLVHGHSDGGV